MAAIACLFTDRPKAARADTQARRVILRLPSPDHLIVMFCRSRAPHLPPVFRGPTLAVLPLVPSLPTPTTRTTAATTPASERPAAAGQRLASPSS